MVRERPNRAADMEVFVTAVERASFSAAARVLGLSPSAVSRTIAAIETRLGVRLMLRTTRALTLTPEGEAYHRDARRILQDLSEAEHAIGNQGAPRGRLRVSSTLAHGRHVLIPLLPEFLERYPAIRVDLSLTDARIDLVEERADVAIRIGPLPNSSLMARRLGDSGRTIIASPAYLAHHGTPDVPEDLRSHNCINFNFRRHDPDWPFRRGEEMFALDVAGNIEANNGETVVQLALEGIGIARVGTFHVAGMIERGELVPLLEAYNPGDREPIHALFIGGMTMPARVRVFVDYLVEKLR